MSNAALGWLGAAFAIAWVLIGGYLVRLWRAQREIARKLEALEKRSGEQRELT